jgi:hypothetical protein
LVEIVLPLQAVFRGTSCRGIVKVRLYSDAEGNIGISEEWKTRSCMSMSGHGYMIPVVIHTDG